MEMRSHAPLSEISPLAQIPVVRLEGGVPRGPLLVGFSSARRRQLAERNRAYRGTERSPCLEGLALVFVFLPQKCSCQCGPSCPSVLSQRDTAAVLRSWLFLGCITPYFCFASAPLAFLVFALPVLLCRTFCAVRCARFPFLCQRSLLRAGLEFWVQASVRGESCAISRAEGTPILSATNVHPRGLRIP